MSARIGAGGNVAQSGDRAGAVMTVSEADVSQPKVLARIFQRVFAELFALKRQPAPKRISFPARAVDATGTTKYRFVHALGIIPDILIVGWSGAAAPNLGVDPSSDNNTLVLVSLSAGTVTLRLEAP